MSNPTLVRVELPAIEELLPQKIPAHPPVAHGMRKFTVFRRADESGVSGTGITVQGCLWADGQCAYQWMNGVSHDLEFRHNFQKFLDIHILSHPKNCSVITWEDGKQDFYGNHGDE